MLFALDICVNKKAPVRTHSVHLLFFFAKPPPRFANYPSPPF